MSKQRAILKTQVAKALKGDNKAADTVIRLMVSLEQAKSNRPESEALGEDDEKLLENFKSTIRAELETEIKEARE